MRGARHPRMRRVRTRHPRSLQTRPFNSAPCLQVLLCRPAVLLSVGDAHVVVQHSADDETAAIRAWVAPILQVYGRA